MKEKEREREIEREESIVAVGRDCGRSEYSSEPPPAVNWNSLEAYADWSARHFSDFNDNRIMMITPFTERTCYLFLSTFCLSLSLSLFLSSFNCLSRCRNLYRAWKTASSIDPRIVRSIRVLFRMRFSMRY